MNKTLIVATSNDSYNSQLQGCSNLVTDYSIVVNVGYEITEFGNEFINLNLDFEKMINFKEVSKMIADIAKEYEVSHLIVAANNYGKTIGPRIATILGSGMIAEVEAINNNQIYTRPAYQNSKKADIIFKGDTVKVFSVKQNAFKASNIKIATKVINQRTSVNSLNVIEKNKIPLSKLPNARIIVSGGKGTVEYYEKVKILAQKFNAEFSGSRELTDKNIINRQEQVGQSGYIIKPDFYLAIGISGSYQHIIGMKNAKHVMVVNIDNYAPICSLADFVVIGDGQTFIDKLLKYMEVI